MCEGEQALVALDLLRQLRDHELEFLDELVSAVELRDELSPALLQLQYLLLRSVKGLQQVVRRVLFHLEVLTEEVCLRVGLTCRFLRFLELLF